MFKNFKSLLRPERTLHAELKLDHLELSREQLIIGLQVTWRNDTREALEIREVMLNLFHRGKKETTIPFNYSGRFVRIPYQKSVTKIAGVTSFQVSAASSRMECIRFSSREILDLIAGNYAVELHSSVPEGTYLHTFEVKVTPEMKYRVSAREEESGQQAAASSSTYTRALRFGST